MVSIMNKLLKGETVISRPVGNSMVPLIKSKQFVWLEPVNISTELKQDDIVYCKVKGRFYTHKVLAVKKVDDKDRFLIGNNKGGINGWIGKNKIYGRVVKVRDSLN